MQIEIMTCLKECELYWSLDYIELGKRCVNTDTNTRKLLLTFLRLLLCV